MVWHPSPPGWTDPLGACRSTDALSRHGGYPGLSSDHGCFTGRPTLAGILPCDFGAPLAGTPLRAPSAGVKLRDNLMEVLRRETIQLCGRCESGSIRLFIDMRGSMSATSQKEFWTTYRAELTALRTQIARIGNNAAQTARVLNSGGTAQPVGAAVPSRATAS